MSPGSVALEKSKNDITIRCTKDGYQDAAGVIPATFQGWTVGNIIFGGLIGLGVDAATGALNEYPNAFQVNMIPLAGTTAPPNMALDRMLEQRPTTVSEERTGEASSGFPPIQSSGAR